MRIITLFFKGYSELEYESLLRLDNRLCAILNDVRKEYHLHSILVTDCNGLSICSSGDIDSTGVAAVAPELLRIGQRSVTLGGYRHMNYVALVLENSHVMLVKHLRILEQDFVLVMDTSLSPKGLNIMLKKLKENIEKAMQVDKLKVKKE